MVEHEQPRDFTINPRSGAELKDIRKNIAHLSQDQVASRIGMTRYDLGLIERGKVAPIDGFVVFQDKYIGAVQGILADFKTEIDNDPRLTGILPQSSQ